MEIFGWIVLIALALFAVALLVIFALPFIVSELKVTGYKIKKAVQDKKLDVDKRSEARKNRDEVKRQRDFELANKKLDAKLLKVDKQIEIQTKKLKLANELRQATKDEKENLRKETPRKVSKKVIDLDYAIPEDDTVETSANDD